MGMLDIFDTDAFSVHSLSLALEKLPFTPGRIGRMNLFTERPATTQIAIIEERYGKLSLLPAMPRGADGQTVTPVRDRKVRALQIPHIPYWSTILAGDLEGKRAFGSETELESFSQVVNDRLEQMKADHEVTHEYHRVGAIKGVVLDATGSVIIDLFDEFNVIQDVVTFDFTDTGDYDNAEPTQSMKTKALQVRRMIQDSLGGVAFTGITAICGDEFFDAFVNHATVRRAYERYQDGSFLREQQNEEGGFHFAGITWENYRGKIGDIDFVADDKAHFFPTGVKDVFIEVPAPADFVETVNTRGQKFYAKQERMKWDKGVELHTQSNVLYLCTRPKSLILGQGENFPSDEGGGSTTEEPTTTEEPPSTTG